MKLSTVGAATGLALVLVGTVATSTLLSSPTPRALADEEFSWSAHCSSLASELDEEYECDSEFVDACEAWGGVSDASTTHAEIYDALMEQAYDGMHEKLDNLPSYPGENASDQEIEEFADHLEGAASSLAITAGTFDYLLDSQSTEDAAYLSAMDQLLTADDAFAICSGIEDL